MNGDTGGCQPDITDVIPELSLEHGGVMGDSHLSEFRSPTSAWEHLAGARWQVKFRDSETCL